MSALEQDQQQDVPGSSLVPPGDTGMAGEEYQEDYGQAGGEGEEEWDAELDQELAGLSEQVEEAEKANAKIQETVNSTKADADEITAEKTRKEEEKKERDARSVFVMNVHFDAKGEQVAEFFAPCGPIVSATIVENKQGQAKGWVLVWTRASYLSKKLFWVSHSNLKPFLSPHFQQHSLKQVRLHRIR